MSPRYRPIAPDEPEHEHDCPGCAKKRAFDAEAAYRRLTQKHMQLANLVSEYMSKAGMERTRRVSDAERLALQIDRIVGGQPATADEFPECCLVGKKNPNGTIRWFCTGVLVHPRVVLTAGHCHVSNMVANVVALHASDQADLSSADVVPVLRMVANPLYVQTRTVHDISVMILRNAAQTAPIGIATTKELNAAQQTTLVGFGNSDFQSTKGFGIKRKVTVDITEVQRKAGKDLGDVEEKLGFDSNLEFVAGGGGFDSCNGDSGGPAYITVGAKRKVAGVTSRAIEGAVDPCGEGGIYSRIDANLTFVKKVASDAGIKL